MGGTAAQVAVERFAHFGGGRRRIAIEKRLGGDHHAAAAVAALARLFVDEGLLQGMGFVDRAQALDGGDLALDRGDRRDAGADLLAVEQHAASAALSEAAAEART